MNARAELTPLPHLAPLEPARVAWRALGRVQTAKAVEDHCPLPGPWCHGQPKRQHSPGGQSLRPESATQGCSPGGAWAVGSLAVAFQLTYIIELDFLD